MQKGKTSYRSKPVPSPSTYNEYGYFNRFGGFHGTTDTYAYVGLIGLFLNYFFRGKFKVASWIWKRNLWFRWVHRSCDTLDFHHDIYCELDPWVRKRDDQERWTRVWTGSSS